MAGVVEASQKGDFSGLSFVRASCSLDSSYDLTGETLTLAQLGLTDAYAVIIDQPNYRYHVEYDYGIDAFKVSELGPRDVRNEAAASGLVQDSDDAATDGVAVYVVVDEQDFIPGFARGHLEFVSPTNTDGSCTIANGGPTLLLTDDDDAATNGVVVRVIAAGGGLEASLTGTQDPVLIEVSNGKFIKVSDTTTADTPGVYFDEDGSNTYDRLLAVVVDNADEPYTLVEVLPQDPALAAGEDLSAFTFDIFVIGV